MSQDQARTAEAEGHHADHSPVELYVDDTPVVSHHHRLSGLQIRELGAKDRIRCFVTEEVDGQGASLRTVGDEETIEILPEQRFRTYLWICLDEVERKSYHHVLNGKQIRELGPSDRVDGFETQKVSEHGKKERTIGDQEEVELHCHERFRTVPNHGGPGGTI